METGGVEVHNHLQPKLTRKMSNYQSDRREKTNRLTNYYEFFIAIDT